MAKISIILPTRGRQSSVYRLLDSIVKTTDNPEDLEIILYTDEDDLESQGISYNALTLIKLTGPSKPMGAITNICYKASTGRYIFLMNDDVIFQTLHWDKTVLMTFEKFQDGIALIYGNDLYKGEGIPTFPIISRTFCGLMDGVCPSGYIRFHIEYHILDIFRRLSHRGYKRIAYLPHVIFEHMHYTIGKSEPDNTYTFKNNTDDEMLFITSSRERYYLALKLAQYIKNHV